MISLHRILIIPALLLLFTGSASAGPARPIPETISLEAMAGQMVMTGLRGDGVNHGTQELHDILKDIRNGKIGGVIFFDRDWQTKKRGRNIVSVAQLARLCALLQKNAPVPLFLAVDQEGGKVRRLWPKHGFPDTPAAKTLGAGTPEITRKSALAMGSALREAGINLNFAPVADVATLPESPAIGALGRAFSDDPTRAAEHAEAFMAGLTEAGVIGSYKHFPGHGSAAADSHHDITDITASWNEAELVLYKRMPPNGPFMIMTGHLRHAEMDPDLPASLSRNITTGLLREKLNWRGVIITDDLEMDAIHRFYSMEDRILLAINAGADIILFGNNLQHYPGQGRRVHATIMNLVHSGKVTPERIAESWTRIRELKRALH